MTETDRLAEIRERHEHGTLYRYAREARIGLRDEFGHDAAAWFRAYGDIDTLLGLVDELQRERDALSRRLTRQEAYAEMAEEE